MRVLITRELPTAGINILKQYKELELDYRCGPPLSEEKLCEAIKDADAIIPVIPDLINKKVIAAAGNKLKVIATYSVGFDHIDLKTATSKGIYVGNTPGNLTEAVAEHALALIFALARRVVEADRYCRTGRYKFWDPMQMIGPKLTGKTLGIIGFGRIGQFLAKMCRFGLGMDILYTDVIAHPEAEETVDAKKVDLDYLLGNSDIVSIHCNLCDETKHLIGEDQFQKMKPLAYLINTARGPIVNEEALVSALERGIIAGTALDVFENEPKINRGLLKMDNVILTPHIASATWEARIQMARMVAENVIDVLINHKPPRYLVNKELLEKAPTTGSGSVSSIA
jgi:glyoxylate reductase